MGKTRLCLSCMSRIDADAAFCPYCKYDGSQENDPYALPIGSRVGEKYVLGRTSDCNGETITYVGFDLTAKTRVLIREFMPLHGSVRDPETGVITPKTGAEIHFKTGLYDFTELYGALRAINSLEGLVRTLDVVSCNSTVYAVLEYFAGVSFRSFVKRNTGKLTAERCMELLSPLFDALVVMHDRKLLHCAVSPDSIKLNRDGDVKIGGFVTPSTRTAGSGYQPMLVDGFAAPEQYAANSFLTPAADVYALAATLYYALTGEVPPSAEQRRKMDTLHSARELNPEVPEQVSAALNAAMVLNPKQRTQTLLELKGNLLGTCNYENPSLPEEEPPQPEPAETPAPAAPEPLAEEADGEPEGTAAGTPRFYKIAALISAGLMLVMGLVYLSWQYILYTRQMAEPDTTPAETEEYYVRSFLGQKPEELQLDGDFSYQLEYAYCTDYEEGVIGAQVPQPGTKYDKGKKVTLKISLGPNTVEVPDFTYVMAENIDAVMEQLDAKLDYSIEYQSSETAPAGTVFEQSVKAGTEVDASVTRIILFVAQP